MIATVRSLLNGRLLARVDSHDQAMNSVQQALNAIQEELAAGGAQTAALQQRVAELEAENATLSALVDAGFQEAAAVPQRIAALEAENAALSSLVDAAAAQNAAIQERLLPPRFANGHLDIYFAMQNDRMVHLERVAGLSEPATGDDVAATHMLEQRLRSFEMRLLSYLEGPYLARVSQAALNVQATSAATPQPQGPSATEAPAS